MGPENTKNTNSPRNQSVESKDKPTVIPGLTLASMPLGDTILGGHISKEYSLWIFLPNRSYSFTFLRRYYVYQIIYNHCSNHFLGESSEVT